ncbi:MAG: tRNA pseudouridine(55) synthase TruB [bacterium]
MLNVFKPVGMTSHDVVALARRRLGVQKTGHAGTLDPAACGVLVLLVGRPATRLSARLAAGDKAYRVEAAFGIGTATGDVEGEITAELKKPVRKGAVLNVLPSFTGVITQTPPMTSAVKVGGRKLYSLAHRGISIERPSREVTVRRLELLDMYRRGGLTRALLHLECSSGTYVRTLVEDMGAALGVPACVTFLLRVRCGGFVLRDAAPLEEVKAPGVWRLLAPPEDFSAGRPV